MAVKARIANISSFYYNLTMPRRKRGRPRKKKEITIKSDETRTVTALVLGLIGVLSVISPFVEGSFLDFIRTVLGIGTIPAGITLILISFSLFGQKFRVNEIKPLIGFAFLTILLSSTAHLIIPVDQALQNAQDGHGGGYLGYASAQFLIDTFGRAASVLILFVLAIFSFSLISGMSLAQIAQFFSNTFSRKGSSETLPLSTDPDATDQFIGSSHIPSDIKPTPEPGLEYHSTLQTKGDAAKGIRNTDTIDNIETEPDEGEPGPKFPNWKTPSLDILSVSKPPATDPRHYKEKSEIIEKTLKSFGIHAKVSDIKIGPRVVQYALSITIGTKVSKVKSLGNDLALALAAPSGSVRIEAPIPGTSLIGIEVPNQKPSFVTLGDMMTSEEMTAFAGRLPLILGKNIAGTPIIHDLSKMPHLLIAGATGSGKSVCVNSFLCGLLMTHSPDYVKLILVDPKMVELPPYNDIPHLLTPVITDVDKVIYSLEWLVTEKQRRFRVLNKARARNVDQYNTSMGFSALPYIILVVDEMADLMLSSGVDVESKIVRLAQMSRAVGIHLVLATQRPSVDVLTGLIKANIPARVGMNVATTVDSRVILDMIGAESLLGDGDMLFKAPDSSRPQRMQGAYVSNKEVEQITNHLKSQTNEVEYNKNVTAPPQTSGIRGSSNGISDDPLFADSVRIVVHAQKASSSLLQRKLRIGYNRAARLIDELYAAKVVGAQDGSKPRKVLVSDAEAFLNRSTSPAGETE